MSNIQITKDTWSACSGTLFLAELCRVAGSMTRTERENRNFSSENQGGHGSCIQKFGHPEFNLDQKVQISTPHAVSRLLVL